MNAAALTLLVAASVAPDAPPPVRVALELARPIETAGSRPTRNVLRIGLEGFRPPQDQDGPVRPPVNLALVLDRSGSMAGDKLDRARQAARMVIDRLGPEDMLSIIAYDSDVEVLLPATRVTNPRALRAVLDQLEASGQTALFAGVSQGIAEVRRFVDPGRVDRVILLSDGQANVGPSAPSELGRLGAAAAREGITVTTIGLGLGYNEDLMARLARDSDGNHGFAESSDDLARFFDAELEDTMSVVAEAIELEIELADGVKIRRAINRPLEQYPGRGVGRLVQLGAEQEKLFLVGLDIPGGRAGSKMTVARVVVRARSLLDGRTRTVSRKVDVRFVRDDRVARANENKRVMVSTVEALAVAQNRVAVELRDQGRIEEAKDALRKNAEYLEKEAVKYESPKLRAYSEENASSVEDLDDERDWRRARKKMRSSQHKLDTQQSY